MITKNYMNKTFSNLNVARLLDGKRKGVSTSCNRVSNNFSPKETKFAERKVDYKSSIEGKKKIVVEKIAIALKFKHLDLFKRKSYTTSKLVSDLNRLIPVKDIEENEKTYTTQRMEKFILQLVEKIPERVDTEVVDMKSRSNNDAWRMPLATEVDDKSNERDLRLFTANNNNSEKNKEKHTYSEFLRCKTQKLYDLRLKEKDEWALLVKQNRLNFLKELDEQNKRKAEKKINFHNTLNSQISEKKILKEKLSNTDIVYLKEMNESNKQYFIEEENKRQRTRLNLLELDKCRANSILESRKRERDLKVKDLSEDINLLDNIKKEIQRENEKIKVKKERLMKYGKEIYNEIHERNEILNKEKIQDLDCYKQKMKEYNEIQDKLELGREKIRNHAKNLYKQTEKYYAWKTEELQQSKDLEEKKFVKEKDELDQRLNQAEAKEKIKHENIKKVMRENLANQLKEKRSQQELLCIEKQNEFKKYRLYEEELIKEKSEEEVKVKKQKEDYKTYLQKQMCDKFFYEEPEKDKNYLNRDFGFKFTKEEIKKGL